MVDSDCPVLPHLPDTPTEESSDDRLEDASRRAQDLPISAEFGVCRRKSCTRILPQILKGTRTIMERSHS